MIKLEDSSEEITQNAERLKDEKYEKLRDIEDR